MIVNAFGIFSLLVSVIFASGSRQDLCRNKRKLLAPTDSCQYHVVLDNCENLVYGRNFSRRESITFVALLNSTCSISNVKYSWTIAKYVEKNQRKISKEEYENVDLSTTPTTNTLTLKPFFLKTGRYVVALTVNKKEELLTDTGCSFFIEAQPPLAVIKGGSERIVPADQSFTMDGSNSINRDVAPRELPFLDFYWNCTLLVGQVADFCRSLPSTRSLIVPSKYAIRDHTYIFTLGVGTRDGIWETTTQLVSVVENAVDVEIVCDKNCPPASARTVTSSTTFLRARCLTNCKNIQKNSFKWSVEGMSFNYEENTQFGRNSDKFVIKPNVLTPGVTYKIRLDLTGELIGGSVKEIETSVPPKILSCTVEPSQGYAIETRFKVDCDYTGQAAHFEIYTKSDRKKVTVAEGPQLSTLNFILPANIEVYAKVTDSEHLEDTFKLKVDVQDKIMQETEETLVRGKISNITRNCLQIMKEGRFKEALQVLNVVIEQIRNKKRTMPVLFEDFKKKTLDNLQMVPLATPEDAVRISSMIARLVHDPTAKSDPQTAVLSTQVCKDAANLNMEHIKSDSFSKSLSEQAKETAKIFMECGETNVQRNDEIMIPEKTINLTTAFPILNMEVIKEDYPEYVDDDSIAIKTKNFELASENFVDICKSNLQAIASTAVAGEETISSATDICSVSVRKIIGKELAKEIVEVAGITIKPSKDFADILDVVDVMMCTWDKDPFWWNLADVKISTKVILLQFLHSEKGTIWHQFKQATEISLNITKTTPIASREIEFPSVSFDHDEDISVVRVDVKKNEAFFVEFTAAEALDSFMVMITNFWKPTLKELREKGSKLSQAKNLLFQENDNDYDSWYYISTLSNKKTIRKDGSYKLKYNISVYTMACYSWNLALKEWQFACPASSNSNRQKIECRCNHLSILAGIIHNNVLKIDKLTTKPNFKMILVHCPIIFICVCVILGIFCLVLPSANIKSVIKGTRMYLLGDTSKYARFVYVVIIKTGKSPSAGTSSNICIKLLGSRSRSKSHLLNYPDPRKTILQRNNEDFFVVATEDHLGSMVEVELWSDHTGRSPSWFCKDVRVFDLQTLQQWYFRIDRWFDLPPSGDVYYKANWGYWKSEKLSKFGRTWKRIHTKGSLMVDFSKFLKLTILLSIIMTIFSVNLMMYGLATLKMNDGFTHFSQFVLYWHVFVITLAGSLISFAVHTILGWLLRNSNDSLNNSKKFSYKVTIYCWSFLTFNIIFSMSILLIFGFWIPVVTGWFWLISSVGAVIIYFSILQNILQRLWRTDTSAEKKNLVLDQVEPILQAVEMQRNFLLKKFGPVMLRPFYSHLYKPMDAQDIKEKQLLENSRLKIIILIEDIIMFILYIILLYLAIYANVEPMSVRNRSEILELLSGRPTRTIQFTSITSIDEFYDYINRTLIVAMQSPQWYSKYLVEEPGLMVDFNNKFLGVARLRQHRVQSNNCTIPQSLMQYFNGTICHKEYSLATVDLKRFGRRVNEFDRLTSVWNYTKVDQAGHSVFVGQFGIYSGGGYIALLGRTMYNSMVNLKYLRKFRWLDLATRVVFVEFLTYNVNSNLFSAVTLMVERSATGVVVASAQVQSTRLLFVNDEDRWMEIIIFGAFAIVVLIFSLKLLGRIFKLRRLFFRDLWSFVDLFIVVLSYTNFALFIHRIFIVKKFLDATETVKKNEFINYFHLFHEDLVFLLTVALLVFVSTIRLWKLLRFATIFRKMEMTVILAARTLLTVLICHVIILLAFSISGYVVFGRYFDKFKDFRDTFTAVLLLSINLFANFDVSQLTEHSPILGTLYYSLYMILSLLFFTIYIAVIMIAYYESQVLFSNEDDFNNVKKYIVDEFIYLKTFLRIKLPRLGGGGVKNWEFVTPKADEHRYADCLILSGNKLKLMVLIAYYEMNKHRMSEREKIDLMTMATFASLREEDSKEFFFETKTDTNRIKIIPDGRLERMRQVVEELVNERRSRMRERRQLKYQTAVERQLRKLQHIDEMLQTLSNVVSKINTH